MSLLRWNITRTTAIVLHQFLLAHGPQNVLSYMLNQFIYLEITEAVSSAD